MLRLAKFLSADICLYFSCKFDQTNFHRKKSRVSSNSQPKFLTVFGLFYSLESRKLFGPKHSFLSTNLIFMKSETKHLFNKKRLLPNPKYCTEKKILPLLSRISFLALRKNSSMSSLKILVIISGEIQRIVSKFQIVILDYHLQPYLKNLSK